jgi:hypothetical protein
MNGATAEPEVSTINPPSRTNQIMIGKSQNFFRSFINDHRSIKNSAIGYLQEIGYYREENGMPDERAKMTEQNCAAILFDKVNV